MATLTCLAGTTVTTHTVSFVFNSSEGLSELGITAPATGKSVELTNGATYTLSDVTLTNTNSSNYINKVFNHNSYGLELYFYNGGSLSFSVPDDCNITQVKFKANNIKYLTNVTDSVWAGTPSQSVSFSASGGTVYVFTIAITYTKTVTTPDLTTVTGISNFKNVTPGTAVKLYLPDDYNARVLAVKNNADGTTDAFVRDNTGAMLMKGISPSRNMAHDQHLAGWINGQYTENNGLPCFVPADGLTNTSLLVIADPVTETATQPQHITPNQYNSYLADWITMNEIMVGDDNFSFVNNFNLADYTAPYEGAIVDASAIVAGDGVLYPFSIGQTPLFTYVIDVTQPFANPPYTITGVPVRLIRTFTAGQWTPFTLPFSTSDFEGDIMAYVSLYEGEPIVGNQSGTTYDVGNMIFARVNEMQAGVPYLVRATNSFNEKAFNSVTLQPVTPVTVTHTIADPDPTNASKGLNETDAFSFVPTLSPVTLSIDKSNKVMLANGTVGWVDNTNNQLQGTSAYFVTPDNEELRIVLYGIDGGIITGINEVSAPAANRLSGIYNMMGVKMQLEWSELPPGIYIVNGRKTIKR